MALRGRKDCWHRRTRLCLLRACGIDLNGPSTSIPRVHLSRNPPFIGRVNICILSLIAIVPALSSSLSPCPLLPSRRPQNVQETTALSSYLATHSTQLDKRLGYKRKLKVRAFTNPRGFRYTGAVTGHVRR